ncbi:MAG: RHS repeat-associated core domain-containing protein, partial [Deltaproteobacteria bacterium]|nr:RHS repeat-associated core domain-containing protein [Deltaproteobacteria bacterium]
MRNRTSMAAFYFSFLSGILLALSFPFVLVFVFLLHGRLVRFKFTKMVPVAGSLLVLLIVVGARPVFSQSIPDPSQGGSGGYNSYTPFQFFSNGEAVDLASGNVLLNFTDLVLPGKGNMDLSVQRSFNSPKPLQQKEIVIDEQLFSGFLNPSEGRGDFKWGENLNLNYVCEYLKRNNTGVFDGPCNVDGGAYVDQFSYSDILDQDSSFSVSGVPLTQNLPRQQGLNLIRSEHPFGEIKTNGDNLVWSAPQESWIFSASRYVGALVIRNINPFAKKGDIITLLIRNDGGFEVFDAEGKPMGVVGDQAFKRLKYYSNGQAVENILSSADDLSLTDAERSQLGGIDISHNTSGQTNLTSLQFTGSDGRTYTLDRLKRRVLYSQLMARNIKESRDTDTVCDGDDNPNHICHQNYDRDNNHIWDSVPTQEYRAWVQSIPHWSVEYFLISKETDDFNNQITYDYPALDYPSNYTVQIHDTLQRTITLQYQSDNTIRLRTADARFPSGIREWVYFHNGDGRIRRMLDPAGNETLVRYDASESNLPLVRHWSLNQRAPNFFVEVRYPTGGVLRYEAAKGIGDVSNSEVLATEFPDDRNGSRYYQKFISIFRSINEGIVTRIYESDGSVFKYFYSYPSLLLTGSKSETPLLVRRELNPDQAASIVDVYAWNLKLMDGWTRVNGMASSTTTENGASYSTRYAYDENGKKISQTNPLGQTTSFAYATSSDADPIVVDRINHLVSKTTTTKTKADGGSDIIETAYYRTGSDICSGQAISNTQVNKVTLKASGKGEETIQELCFDVYGNVIKQTRMQDPEMTYEYDRGTFLAKVKNDSETTTASYASDSGNLLSVTNPDGRIVSYRHDAFNRVTQVSYPNGSNISYGYGLRHGGVAASENGVTTDVYDASREKHMVVERFFDGMDRLSLIRKGGDETQYRYAGNKLVSEVVMPGDQRYKFNYDGLKRIASIVYPGGKEIRYSYASAVKDSKFVNSIDIRQSGKLYSRLERDALGRVIGSAQFPGEGEEEVIHYTYDEENNLIQTESPAGLKTKNIFDQYNRLTTRTYPDGDRVDINHLSNERGLLDSVVIQDSLLGPVTGQLTFDDKNRMTRIDYPSLYGSELNDYQIEYAGRQVKAINDVQGSMEFGYTPEGVLNKIHQNVGDGTVSADIEMGSDGFGKSYWIGYPDGTRVFYITDEKGRVSQVRLGGSSGRVVAQLSYNAQGRLGSVRFGNGEVSSYTYDPQGRVTQIRFDQEGKVTNQISYSYDERGNKTSIQYLDGSKVALDYDGMNRLMKAKYFKPNEQQPFNTQEYSYDKDGNRTRYSDAYKTVNYTYDKGRLTKMEIGSDLVRNLGYDVRGNLESEQELLQGKEVFNRQFKYDLQDRLMKATVQDKEGFHVEADYQYDYASRKVSKTVNGEAKQFYVYGNAADPLMETNGKGEIETIYIYLGGKKIAAFANENLQYFHGDEMGNTLHVTDDSGDVVETYRYDPFGNINFHAGVTQNRYQFAGKEYDDTLGLVYFGARYYDPQTGRFISRDPMEDGINHYIYAVNNPLVNEDYFGLGFFSSIGNWFKGLASSVKVWAKNNGKAGITVGSNGSGAPDITLKIQNVRVATWSPGSAGGSPPPSSIENNLNSSPSHLSIDMNSCGAIVCLRTVSGVGSGNVGSIGSSSLDGNDFSGGSHSGGGSGSFGNNGIGDSLFQITAVADFSSNNVVNPYLLNANQWMPERQEAYGGQGPASISSSISPLNIAPPSSTPEIAGTPMQTPREPFEVNSVENGFSGSGQSAPIASTFRAPLDYIQSEDTTIATVHNDIASVSADNNSGDPVILFGGDFLQVDTDLKIPGRGFDYQFTRTYRSRVDFEGPLGFNWDHNYNKRLVEMEGGNIRRFDGDARFDDYKLVEGKYVAPAGRFDRLIKNADGTYHIRDNHGTVYNYAADGFISAIIDRNDNQITFTYFEVADQKRLDFVTDTLGRKIEYEYDGTGRLTRVEDFSGRTIRFDYDNNSDLVAAHSPAVDGFPLGKITRYAYSSGFGEDSRMLNHNLISVTSPKGQTFVKNEYSSSDRVTRQTFGNKHFNFSYYRTKGLVSCSETSNSNEVVSRTTVTDRAGNVTEHSFNCQGNPLKIEEFTRGMVSGSPQSYVTAYEYNSNGLVTQAVLPNGNRVQFEYESKNTGDATLDHLSSANRLSITRVPDARSGGENLVTRFAYEPLYNQVRSVTDPRGDAFTTRIWFDYQEGNSSEVLATKLGASTEVLQSLLTGVSLGLGDLNQDGDTAQVHGNAVQIDSPALQEAEGVAGQLVTRFQYNPFGQLTTRIEPSSKRHTFAYGNNGYLQTLTKDSGGLAVTNHFEQDAVGNITRFTDGRGNIYRFDINTLNQVTREIFPSFVRRGEGEVEGGGAERRIAYDANNNVARVAEPDAAVTSYVYNLLDYPVTKTQEVSGSKSVLTEYQYDANDNLSKIVEPEGTSVAVTYDERDMPVRIVRGVGSVESSTYEIRYDGNKNRISVRDGMGSVTLFEYDGFDRLLRQTNPLGSVKSFEYNSADDLVNITLRGPPNGETADNVLLQDVHLTYDAVRRLVEQKEAILDAGNLIGERSTRLQYNNDSLVTQLLDGENHATQFQYDGLNRVASVTDAEGNATNYEYDGNGNVTAVTRNEINTAEGSTETFVDRYVYDVLNRLVSTTDGADNIKQYGYDSRGTLTSFVDPNGNTTRFFHDGLSRLTRMVQPGDVTTLYQWDDNSRLATITDAKNQITRFGYDALNRKISTELPNGAKYTNSYDRNSNLLSTRDPNGFIVNFNYDAVGRLAQKNIYRGNALQGSEAFGYDGLRRMTSAETRDPAGALINIVAQSHDSLGRTVRETQGSLMVAKVYDKADRLNQLVYPSGKVVSFTHDNADRVRSITDARLGKLADIAYANRGAIGSIDYASGDYIETRFDSIGRPISHLNRFADNTLIAGFESGYDKNSNRLFETFLHEENKGSVYRYDTLGRLDKATYGVPDPSAHLNNPTAAGFLKETTYTMDALHNWLERQVVIANPEGEAIQRVSEFVPNEVNAYTSVDGTAYIYDANGNLIDDGTYQYAYDYRNFVTEVRNRVDGSLVASYSYDALGRRVGKTTYSTAHPEPVEGRTITFIYDGIHVIEEYEGGLAVAKYTQGVAIDQLIAMERGEETYFYHTDTLGNVVALTNASGAIVERYTYTAYGEVEI